MKVNILSLSSHLSFFMFPLVTNFVCTLCWLEAARDSPHQRFRPPSTSPKLYLAREYHGVTSSRGVLNPRHKYSIIIKSRVWDVCNYIDELWPDNDHCLGAR